jgi:DNA-binding NarL/FixJ family response regulator
MMARAADDRAVAAGLSREDRALTGVSKRANQDEQQAVPTVSRVFLWADRSDASRALRDLLAVNGFRVTLLDGDDAPPNDVEGESVLLVVVASFADGLARLERLRAKGDARLVIAAGAKDAAEVARWISLGASDVVLESAPKDELAKKVKRVFKRGR